MAQQCSVDGSPSGTAVTKQPHVRPLTATTQQGGETDRTQQTKRAALWWTRIGKGLTVREFFTWPSSVNEADTRLHNIATVATLGIANYLAYYRDWPWLFAYLVWGFAARILTGPRLDPQSYLVLFGLRPLVVDKLGLLRDKYSAASPKRFSQVVGLGFGLAATVFTFQRNWQAAWTVSGMFAGAAALAGFGNFCIACIMYEYAGNRGLVPKGWCSDCLAKEA